MIIATKPSTKIQPIEVARIPALQLPAGQKPEVYYMEQVKDPNSAFYKAAASLATLSLTSVVNIISSVMAVAMMIAQAVSAFVTVLSTQAKSNTPIPATASLASPHAAYRTEAPALPSSDIPLPPVQAAPRYVARKPFEGEGLELGRGYFAEKCENGGFNVWFGTGALRPLANVPDEETARRFVDTTYRAARGHMEDGHFVPDAAFLEAANAAITTLTLKPA